MGVRYYSIGGVGFVWTVCDDESKIILKAIRRYAVERTFAYRITYDLLCEILKDLGYELGDLPEKAKGKHLFLYHDEEERPDDFYCFVEGTYFQVKEDDDIQMGLPPKRKVQLMKEVLKALDFVEGRMRIVVMTRCF